MHFEAGFTYHIYNRSNQRLYKSRENYLYFLEKLRNYILPYVDLLAWCLMPNHFHLMLCPNEKAIEMVKEKHLPHTQILSKQVGTFLSSYTKAFNKQDKRRGRLFAHNTEAKLINQNSIIQADQTKLSYAINCFRYIHYNPIEANLANNLREWEFSSYNDYAGLRKGSLVNKKLAQKIVNFDEVNFEAWSLMDLNF